MRQSDYKGGHLLKTLPVDQDPTLTPGTKVMLLDDSSPDPLISSGLSERLISKPSTLKNVRTRTRSPTPTTEGVRSRRKASVEPKVPPTPSRSSARIAERSAKRSQSVEVNSPDESSKEEGIRKKMTSTKDNGVNKLKEKRTKSTTTRANSRRNEPTIEEQKEEEEEVKKKKKEFAMSKESPKKRKKEPVVLDDSDGSDEETTFGGKNFQSSRKQRPIQTFKGRSSKQFDTYTANKNNSRLNREREFGVTTKGELDDDDKEDDIFSPKFKDARKEFTIPDLKDPKFHDISKKYSIPKYEDKGPQFEDLSKKYDLPSSPTRNPPTPALQKDDKTNSSSIEDDDALTFGSPLDFISGRTIQTPAPTNKTKKKIETTPRFVNAIAKFGGAGLDSPDELQFARHCADSEPESQLPSSQFSDFKHLSTSSLRSNLRKRKCYEDILDLTESPAPRRRSSSPLRQPDHDASFSIDPEACVICGEHLDTEFVNKYNPCGIILKVAEQIEFCKRHKRISAEKECLLRKYPARDIDWRKLPKRIGKYMDEMRQIIESKKGSGYRNELSIDAKKTKNNSKKLMGTDFESHTPGYYGPKGAHIIMEILMSKLANHIREVGVNDRLIAGGGVSGFVQSVLVPELGVRLVMEDMNVDEEKAKQIVKSTAEIGELLNEEDEAFDYDEEDSYWDDGTAKSNGNVWLEV